MGARDWEWLRAYALEITERWEEAETARQALEGLWKEVDHVTYLTEDGDTASMGLAVPDQLRAAWRNAREIACPHWPAACPSVESLLGRFTDRDELERETGEAEA